LFNYNSREHLEASFELPIASGEPYKNGDGKLEGSEYESLSNLTLDNYDDVSTPEQIKLLAKFIDDI